MPHVRLSLQAGDDMVLTRMKRRHRRADAVRLIERLKAARPDIAIGADLIAGFPTADDAMFANSLALIDDCDIVFGHIRSEEHTSNSSHSCAPRIPSSA